VLSHLIASLGSRGAAPIESIVGVDVNSYYESRPEATRKLIGWCQIVRMSRGSSGFECQRRRLVTHGVGWIGGSTYARRAPAIAPMGD
jgi:hypothetical protein